MWSTINHHFERKKCSTKCVLSMTECVIVQASFMPQPQVKYKNNVQSVDPQNFDSFTAIGKATQGGQAWASETSLRLGSAFFLLLFLAKLPWRPAWTAGGFSRHGQRTRKMFRTVKKSGRVSFVGVWHTCVQGKTRKALYHKKRWKPAIHGKKEASRRNPLNKEVFFNRHVFPKMPAKKGHNLERRVLGIEKDTMKTALIQLLAQQLSH